MTRREYCERWCDPKYGQRLRQEAKDILSDGCSGVPDFYWLVCVEHDWAYAHHLDFYTKNPITEEEADLMLKWGIQWHSWFGRWSPMAWWRYTGLSKEKGLGFGSTAWKTGPQRLIERLAKKKPSDIPSDE